MPADPKKYWNILRTVVLIVLVMILAILPWVQRFARDLFSLWLAATLVLTAFMILAGRALTGRLPGLLIDSGNRMSLSRLQMIVWTVLILPAFLAAAAWNLDHPTPPAAAGAPPPACVRSVKTALDITIPMEIWGLMGISTASLIGSPLIKNIKRDSAPPTGTGAEKAAQEAKQEDRVPNGLMVENPAPDRARWADLIQGEEIGNFRLLDLGKVQMLFFTVIVLTGYAAAIAAAFNQAMPAGKPGVPICDFPELGGGMLALLAISHAGYLTYKAVPQTSTK